jgi:hypothetical protein
LQDGDVGSVVGSPEFGQHQGSGWVGLAGKTNVDHVTRATFQLFDDVGAGHGQGFGDKETHPDGFPVGFRMRRVLGSMTCGKGIAPTQG